MLRKNLGILVLLVGACVPPDVAWAQAPGGQRGPEGAAPDVMTTQNQDQMYTAWRERVESVDKPAAPTGRDQRVIQQVVSFRKQLEDAIKSKDAAKLSDYFADDYIITLGNALVDGKASRIQWLLAGRPPFEVQPIDTAQYRVLDKDNVVMTANQKYTMGGDGGSSIQYGALRSIFIFTKNRPSATYKGWRLLASQALRVPVVPPKAPVYGPSSP